MITFEYHSAPPGKPVILDEAGSEVRLKLGPYKVGDTLTINCEVSAGVTQWELLIKYEFLHLFPCISEGSSIGFTVSFDTYLGSEEPLINAKFENY